MRNEGIGNTAIIISIIVIVIAAGGGYYLISGFAQQEALGKVKGLEITENIGRLTLSWKDIKKAEKYKIYRDGKFLTKSNSSVFTDQSVRIGISYTYRVSMIRGESEGPKSSPKSGTPSVPAKSIWPSMFHDSRHTLRSDYEGPKSPSLLWTKENATGTVVGRRGTIYGRAKEEGNYSIVALDPLNGGIELKIFQTQSKYWYPITVGSDGTIYVLGNVSVGTSDQHSTIHAFSANGTKKWTHSTEKGSYALKRSVAVGSDGTIYVAAERIYAIAENGDLRWKSREAGGVVVYV